MRPAKRREDGKILIFTPYITIRGVRRYPPQGRKVWAIWVDPNKPPPPKSQVPPSGSN